MISQLDTPATTPALCHHACCMLSCPAMCHRALPSAAMLSCHNGLMSLFWNHRPKETLSSLSCLWSLVFITTGGSYDSQERMCQGAQCRSQQSALNKGQLFPTQPLVHPLNNLHLSLSISGPASPVSLSLLASLTLPDSQLAEDTGEAPPPPSPKPARPPSPLVQ